MPFPIKIANSDTLINGGFGLGNVAPSYVRPFGYDGTSRYFVLSDVAAASNTNHPTNNVKLRMYCSTNNGTSWVELDSTNAPTIAPDNGTYGTQTFTNGPIPGAFQFYNCCADNTNEIVYSIYFSTNYNVTAKPFHINTATPTNGTWGSAVESAIQYFGTANNDPLDRGGFLCEFRYSDNSLWAIWEDNDVGQQAIGTSTISGDPTFLYGANFNGSTWGTRTILSSHDTAVYRPTAIKVDSANIIHFFYEYRPYILNTSTGGGVTGALGTASLIHNSISTLNALGGTTVIDTASGSGNKEIGYVSPPVLYTVSGTDTIGITYKTGGLTAIGAKTVVARAVATVTPTFTLETLTTINNSYDSSENIQPACMVRLGTLDYVEWAHYIAPDEIVSEFDFITSTGIGGAWSVSTLVGTFGTDSTGNLISNQVVAVAFSTSTSIGITMPFGTNWGVGYWEPVVTPPPAGVQIFFIPQYIKRHNAPGH